jgi:hypothetical protein
MEPPFLLLPVNNLFIIAHSSGPEICSIPISTGYQILKLDIGHHKLNKYLSSQIEYFSVVYESFINMS